MKRVTKKTANDTIVLAVVGVTKVFVGEIVETGKKECKIKVWLMLTNIYYEARTTMEEWGEKGAVQPRHIREAYRRLKMANKIPYYQKHRRVFRRHR